MSSSTGNDANDGLSALTPWQTLGRLQAAGPFVPGDLLQLKAGDIWTGETFEAIGTGQYDYALYNSTFSATLASQTVVYQTGPVFTAFHARLIAAGITEPTATNVANDYCARLARIDALDAATAAADASVLTKWITFTRYGAGVPPIIAPGGLIKYGIHFSNLGVGGGWKVKSVDIHDCQFAGIDIESGLNAHPKGFWIEDIELHNITGIPPLTIEPGCDLICGPPVMVSRCDSVLVKNIRVPGSSPSDLPVFLIACNGYVIDGVVSDNTKYTGIWLSLRLATSGAYQVGPTGNDVPNNGVIKNCTLTQMGFSIGLSFGTAGIQQNGGNNIYMVDNVIDHVGPPSGGIPDRIGVDWEGYDQVNPFMLRCTLKNCVGSGLLIFTSSGGLGSGSIGGMIVDSVSDSNHGTPNGGNPTFMRLYNNLLNDVVIVGLTITRAVPVTQFLNFISDGIGPQGNVNTFPARFITADISVLN